MAKATCEVIGDQQCLEAGNLASSQVAQAEALFVSPQFMLAKKRS